MLIFNIDIALYICTKRCDPEAMQYYTTVEGYIAKKWKNGKINVFVC